MIETRLYRSLRRVTPPKVEPVSLTEAMRHMRVDIDADANYVASLLSTAREWVEAYLDRTLIDTQWEMRLDFFPVEIELPRPPVSTMLTDLVVTYKTSTEEQVTLPSDRYRVDRHSTPGVVRNLYGGSWPSALTDQNSISITWWAGYGPSTENVPAAIRHGILMICAHLYERRLAVDNLSQALLPFGAMALLDAHRWGAYR